MPISDDKLDELLEAFKIAMAEMTRVHKKNEELHIEMLKMYKMNMELQNKGPEQQHQINVQSDSTQPTDPQNISQSEVGQNDNRDDFSNHPRNHHPNRVKPKRPTVKDELDGLEWEIFTDAWKRYKKIANLSGQEEVCMELRETCSEEVNQLLYQFVGSSELNRVNLTEAELLEHIRTVAVKSIHPEVHRWNFAQVSQAEGEGITRYAGRLKAQAALCNFTVKCDCQKEVSYSEHMVSQKMIAGLSNPEHQSRILSEVQDLPDLKSKLDRLVSLETTDDAATMIQASPMTTRSEASKSSEYRKIQRGRSPLRGNPPSQRSRCDRFRRRRSNSPKPGDLNRYSECRGCGKTQHGKDKTMARKDCPAFGRKCESCGMENHFSRVCERRSRSGHIGTDDEYSNAESDDEIYASSDVYTESEGEGNTSRISAVKIKRSGFR